MNVLSNACACLLKTLGLFTNNNDNNNNNNNNNNNTRMIVQVYGVLLQLQVRVLL